MKLKFAEQLSFSTFIQSKYDIFISASGYESRSTALGEKVSALASKKVVIGFEERLDHKQRIENDKKFKALGFEEYIAKEGSYEDIISILDIVLSKYLFLEKVSLVIDYSCMTKVWYTTIINYCQNKYSEIVNLDLIFSYTPSVFSEPQPPMPNKYMGPIPGIYRVSTSYKPTALILGLGYEKEAAKGIVEYLDPQITYAFYSKPAFDENFVNLVEKNNEKLIEYLGEDKVFRHSVGDLINTDSLLTTLCVSLRSRYRIILAPLGPKPFALMSLLVATKYPDIDVWRVSSGDSGNIYDRAAADTDPVICKISFENELKRIKEGIKTLVG